jgi:heat shock protein HslJ
MTDQTHNTLDRLMDDVLIGPAPIDTLLTAGRAAKRRNRRASIAGVAAATALILGGGAMATQALTSAGSTVEGTVATDPSRTPSEVPTSNAQTPLEGIDGTWMVQALVGADGQSALPAAYRGEVQLTFDDGEVKGTTGCNDIFGTYQHDGEDLRLPRVDLGTTLVGCNNEPPLVEHLEDVRHISPGEDGTSLILHADNWMIVAVLERIQSVTASPSDSSTPLTSGADGSRTRHTLMTHCGVRSTVVDGRLWLATPPLGDDSGNPPQGWDENQTNGWFEETSANTATFTGDGGQVAKFRLAKRGERDPAAGCE